MHININFIKLVLSFHRFLLLIKYYQGSPVNLLLNMCYTPFLRILRNLSDENEEPMGMEDINLRA